uniref:UBC core domain-containing protein n=1 Tax=Panagrolaimus sp. ES5 TaxID=591445 RepID=A0AC34G8L2_9BILA
MLQQRLRTPASQDLSGGDRNDSTHPQHNNNIPISWQHQSAPLPQIPRPNIKTILSGGIKEFVEKNGVSNPFFSAKRIMNDLTELEEKPMKGIYVGAANDHIHELFAVIEGPKDTVYESGIFFVDVFLPQSYPFQPPQLKFRTRIYHPHIDLNGVVSLNSISKEWKPKMTLLNIFEALISLLHVYDLEEPSMLSILNIYKNDPSEFERTARLWTQRYSICNFDP